MNLKRVFPLTLPFQRVKPTLIIHSDDWGSIRMPSEKVRRKLDKHPLIDAQDPYARYDSLASVSDLEALFEILSSVKDFRGDYAVLTPNVIMSNPDFQLIKRGGFEEFFYEPFSVTFSKYNNERALDLWSQGIKSGVFSPQYHGREHVNVKPWLQYLRNGHEGVRMAFDNEVFGVNFKKIALRKANFQATWDFYNKEDEVDILSSIEEGYYMFNNYFGYPSKTVIAPSYTWTKKMETKLFELGVKSMQGLIVQKQPVIGSRSYKKKYHIIYSSNYQMRNVFFEPSLTGTNNIVRNSLKRISDAIKMGHPAIISSHRLNFISKHCVNNRDRNLKLLQELLLQVKKRWPQIRFLGADDFTN